jgi:peptidylprolyl isomerase
MKPSRLSILVAVAVCGTLVSARLSAAPIEPLPPAPPPEAPAAPKDVAAAPADAKKTASGLASKVLLKGKGGAHPGPHDRVTVEYTGWTTDGKVFDSSVPRGEPAKLSLDSVIKGWTEGLQLMVKGEKRRFWIPGDLAYGERPEKRGAPAGALVFDVELIDFLYVPPPPETPPDLEAPPKDAKKTASGLSYKILKHGKGKEHPRADSTVEVHYSGWTTEGKLFDSSVTRGQPATFPLDGVIKGWTEGLQLLVVGDKARFWIPGNLAYGDEPKRPGAPAGTLVFDVELLGIR